MQKNENGQKLKLTSFDNSIISTITDSKQGNNSLWKLGQFGFKNFRMKSYAGCSHIVFHKNMIWSDLHSLEHIFLIFGFFPLMPEINFLESVSLLDYVFRTKISFFSREWLRQTASLHGVFRCLHFFRCFGLEMSVITFLLLTHFF